MIIVCNTLEQYINIDFLYRIEGYSTYKVNVKNGNFSGETNFCVSEKQLKKFKNKLVDIGKSLNGECELNDFESDSKLSFKCLDYGHVLISGQIGDSQDDNFLIFRYEGDQTIFNYLIDVL